MFFFSNLFLALSSVLFFYYLGIENIYLLMAIFALSLPYKIKGNYYSFFGGEVDSGSIYSLITIFQKSEENTISIFSAGIFQYAKIDAISYFGILLYQRSKKRSDFFAGIVFYQKARKNAEFFIGICLFQKSGYESIAAFAIIIKQYAYKNASLVFGIILIQEARNSFIVIGVNGNQTANLKRIGLGIRLSSKEFIYYDGIKDTFSKIQ